MPEDTRSPASAYLAAALLSAAMLSLELSLTRLFALAQFYHFAFMVISLALLGTGAAGSLLSVWPALGRWPGRWAAGFAAAALSGVAVLNWLPFDSYAVVWDARQIPRLLLTLAAAAAPFLCSGAVISGLLAADPGRSHQVYAANLAGSALGCAAVLPLLEAVGGVGAVLVSAALGLIAAALFSRPSPAALAPAALALVLIGLAARLPPSLDVRLSPYKPLSQALLAPEARLIRSRWTASARIDVVSSGAIHILPGLGQNILLAAPPPQAGLLLDGDNLMPITELHPADPAARELAAHVPLAAAFALRPEAHAILILEPGGGWDVLMALAGGASSVTAVERHPAVIDLLGGPLAAGLYADPRVEAVVTEGRVYLRQTAHTYDVIDIALSDSFHPVTSGAYSLGEDYRYTVEAVSDALDRLSPGGVLVVTRWLQNPPTEPLRLLATVEAALRAQGAARPGEHLAAFRSLRTLTILAVRDPLTAADEQALRAFAADRGYDLVWLPSLRAEETNRAIRLPEDSYFLSFAALLADPAGFVRAYEYDIRPPTDDRPFFAHYFRWRQTPAVLAGLGHTWQPFGGSGYLVLVALLIAETLLAALLILGPLAARHGRAARSTPARLRASALLYFAMLGLGFLFIELPLSQRFILFIGQPITALAVVLFAVLLFSGLGSLSAPRWPPRLALAALVAAGLATPLALDGIFAVALGWPLAARAAAGIASLAPLGMLMGVPFARGLALIEQAAPGLTPWAWAVNGSASVIAAVLAVMFALSAGFTAVLWLGAGCYGIAWLAAGWLARRAA